jgi:hypothetical protein
MPRSIAVALSGFSCESRCRVARIGAVRRRDQTGVEHCCLEAKAIAARSLRPSHEWRRRGAATPLCATWTRLALYFPGVEVRLARRDRLTGRVSWSGLELVRRGLLWGGVAACGSWIGGCSLVEGCDAAGCSSGVSIDAPGITVDPDEFVTIRACVEGTCGVQRSNVAGGLVEVGVPDNTDEVSVTVTIEDHRGRVVAREQGTARVELVWPNGDDCPPECRVVRVRLQAGRLLPATA